MNPRDAEDSLSAHELALVAELIAAAGTPGFYERSLALLGERIPCERRLVVKYSRFARPEFIVNTSLDEQALAFYLDGLYRLDPLLRLSATDAVRPVVSYREIRRVDPGNSFFDEIFRAGLVFDELAVMLPTLGGAHVALCFDRDDACFGPHETQWASLLYPVLLRAHESHVRTGLLSGLHALFGDSRVGILGLGESGQVVYRNESWARAAARLDETEVVARMLRAPERAAVEIGGCVGHWEYLDAREAPLRAVRALFLEERSAGYLTRDVRGALGGFIERYQLSTRESQILEKMMRGHPTGSISAKLGLSAGTVKNYKRRLYDKLDITNEREIFPLFLNHLFGEAEAQSAARDAAARTPQRAA